MHNHLIDERRGSRIIAEEYKAYRELIIKDVEFFLDSLIIEFEKMRLEQKYGSHYN
jgi:hypothetical protein